MTVLDKMQLKYLFGDAKKVIAFYEKATPSHIEAITLAKNPTQSQIMDLDIYKLCDDVCRACKNKQMFPDCKHIIKRMVDRCEGAMSELTWNEILK
jgi:hypothetical protein